MQYFRLPGEEIVRTDRATGLAEYFDDVERDWVRNDAYFLEVHLNGQGVPISDAVALAAVG